MRLLHVVPSYIPAWRYGGPIRSVHGLCRGLAGLGHEVHVYTTNVDGDRDSDVPLDRPVPIDGVQVHYFPSGRLRRLFYSSAMARGFRRDLAGFDMVHTHSVYLWPTWAAARQAAGAGVPYVVSPKGQLVRELIRRKSPWLKRAWIALIERRTLEGAAGIQVSSNRELEEFMSFGFHTPQPFVIPHGIDLPGPAPSSGPPPPPTDLRGRVLFLGRINWEKGLDRLVKAMAHVPAAELVLAGNDEEGFTDRLAGIARDAGVADRVRFHGPVDGDSKWELLASAAVAVLSSYSESFGIAALEAMAMARPVVVTPEVGLADIVREADSGIVVDGAPEKLGAAIDRLLADPVESRRLGDNGRRTVEEKLTWSGVALQMQRRYEEIIRQP